MKLKHFKDYTLNINDAIKIVFDGGMVVGNNFNKGVIMKKKSDDNKIKMYIYLHQNDKNLEIININNVFIKSALVTQKYKKISTILESI